MCIVSTGQRDESAEEEGEYTMKQKTILVLAMFLLIGLISAACVEFPVSEPLPPPPPIPMVTEPPTEADSPADLPEEATPSGTLDLQSLLRENFNDVRHLLGNERDDPAAPYLSLRRVHYFDTGIVVTVDWGRITHISFGFSRMGEEARSRIHFNTLHAGSTRLDVRNMFGEPDEEDQWGSYTYLDRTRLTLLFIRFGANDNFEGFNYMAMPLIP